MMVLEYCELPLKTWLSGLGKMTPDILDDMCVISLNVSNGVEHLHERKVIKMSTNLWIKIIMIDYYYDIINYYYF